MSRYGSSDDGSGLLSAILVIIVLAALCVCNFGIPSEGERTGKIVKLAYKGFMWKTYEAEMVLTGVMDKAWKFSIDPDNSAVISQVKAHLGKECTIRYKQYPVSLRSNGGTSYQAIAVLDSAGAGSEE